MAKNDDKYNNRDIHFSYNEYKQKVKKTPNFDILIFVSVFVIGLFIILGFVKTMSPGVDVEIASGDEYSQYEEDSYQSSIDERLRHLQNEDANGSTDDDEMFSSDLDEKVVLPKQKRKTAGEIEAEKQMKAFEEQQKEQREKEMQLEAQKKEEAKKDVPSAAPSATPAKATATAAAPTPAKIVNAKVVVGYYANNDQAEVAKDILQDAGIGVTPIIKNMGNYYTLQVGSYTTEEKANQAANNLLKSNFPARVIIE